MITQNIIGFDISSRSDKRIYSFDPELKSQLPEAFSVATQHDIDLALQKANDAWRIFRSMNPARRASFLLAIADGIEALGETLVKRIMQETAYSETRILIERSRTVAQLRMYAEYIIEGTWQEITIDRAIPGRVPTPRPDLRKFYMAIGPVIVFAASNFPLAYSTIGGDSTSALAAGCPVIVKAHESHLGTNALVAEIILKAAKKTSMPDGVFSSLNGDGIETGKQLVIHPLTSAVGFTGSLSGGRALFDLGNQREKPIPVFAEMGSVNPVFLFPDKVKNNSDRLSDMLVDSMTMSTGQFCTNPGILIAIDDKYTKHLITILSAKLRQIPASTMLDENIAGNFHSGIDKMRSDPNVSYVIEDAVPDKLSATPVLATVRAEYFLQHKQLHHEVFGPFSLVVICKDFMQMKSVAAIMEGQLTATIHASVEEYKYASELTTILVEKAGRIIYDGVPTGVEVCAAMTHGGPYPACTDSRFTAVGHHAIRRWLRPVTFQNCPDVLLPEPLKESF